VARGNRKVFEEIAREFARFIAACADEAAFDPGRIAGFCDALRPGEPPEGQRYLRQAFARYYQSFFESNPKARAELLLLANSEIGLHEQTRLQPEIQSALNAPFIVPGEFKRRLAAALVRRGDWLALARWLALRLIGRLTPLDAAAEAFVAVLQRQARRIATEALMRLDLPRGLRLRLGQDLSALYPPSLQHLDHPDLRALLARFDPTPDSTRDTGALDWADLPERLHFILDLFRCFQEARDLFEPPFTAEQVAALKAGRRPDGRL
jgi:hypothetical protein